MRKYIRFNYFIPVLVPVAHTLRAEMEGQEELPPIYPTWQMEPFLNYLDINPDLQWHYQLGDEYAEVEPKSIITRNVILKGFQLTKLRETNIPAKKKIGLIKQDIMLQDDEYIGEFVTCLFDIGLGVLAVQSNRYGLNITQIEELLSHLRLQYCNTIGDTSEQDNPNVVKLQPILDTDGMEAALNAQIVRKIRFRAADFMADEVLQQNPLLGSARNLLSTYSGANIEIIVSIGQAPINESLNLDQVHDSIHAFDRCRQEHINGINLEITKRDDTESAIDVINLVTPKMTDIVSAEVAPRTSIGHDYLLDLIVPKYTDRRPTFSRILLPSESD